MVLFKPINSSNNCLSVEVRGYLALEHKTDEHAFNSSLVHSAYVNMILNYIFNAWLSYIFLSFTFFSFLFALPFFQPSLLCLLQLRLLDALEEFLSPSFCSLAISIWLRSFCISASCCSLSTSFCASFPSIDFFYSGWPEALDEQ